MNIITELLLEIIFLLPLHLALIAIGALAMMLMRIVRVMDVFG